MDAATWQRVEALFHGALAQPAAQREAWLRKACAGDPALQAAVEKLLCASAPSTDTLDRGIAVSGNAPAPVTAWQPLAQGELVGSYRILQALGQGAMEQRFDALPSSRVHQIAP